MANTIHIGDVAWFTIWDHALSRADRKPEYRPALQYLRKAHKEACTHGLRVNRKSNIVRDNRLGVLSQPVNPSEWPELSVEDAKEEIAHNIWCDAVRFYNIERG